MKIIFDYNRTIFDPESGKLYPGVFELLKKLSLENELFLVSFNEPGRKETIDGLKIGKYFQKILFVDEKTVEIFLKLVGKDKKVIVVGDSVRSEIRIGNMLGFVTVRVAQGKFKLQEPENENEIANYEVDDIRKLEKIIKIYE